LSRSPEQALAMAWSEHATDADVLTAIVRSERNPFVESDRSAALCLSVNLFGLNWLEGKGNKSRGIRDIWSDQMSEALQGRDTPYYLIRLLGRTLRSEMHSTSWLNMEKALYRHRIVACFGDVLATDIPAESQRQIVIELFDSIASSCPGVTVDVRGQCGDLLLQHAQRLPTRVMNDCLAKLEKAITSFGGGFERPLATRLTEEHDTIDPHIRFPRTSHLRLLEEAAKEMAHERAFEFSARLVAELHKDRVLPAARAESLLTESQPKTESLRQLRRGVLTCEAFEEFISARLPSFLGRLEDYVVNRDQIVARQLTIHELCRWLVARPENGSSSLESREAVTQFYRQVFGIGQACNVGLDARAFFIDHGFAPSGERLDWPSYVFLPAGSIWGKGTGIDLSCGVAVGGGVDLKNRRGRDGVYLGGSWSGTLYHGHSHVGGTAGSRGAESRDKIVHYGLTVEDGRRLPWGEYIEAEDHEEGGRFEGVRTYRLLPRA
jgi:hypothetical protein